MNGILRNAPDQSAISFFVQVSKVFALYATLELSIQNFLSSYLAFSEYARSKVAQLNVGILIKLFLT